MLRIGMLRIRIIGLCLVAAFAMSAVAASSAMAQPGLERGVCKVAKKGLGEYTEALCLTPGAKAGPKKEYVWVEGTKATAFTTKGRSRRKARNCRLWNAKKAKARAKPWAPRNPLRS